jgi:hypothetical protein
MNFENITHTKLKPDTKGHIFIGNVRNRQIYRDRKWPD